MRPRSLMDPSSLAFPDVNRSDELVSEGGGAGISTTIWCIPTKISMVVAVALIARRNKYEAKEYAGKVDCETHLHT